MIEQSAAATTADCHTVLCGCPDDTTTAERGQSWRERARAARLARDAKQDAIYGRRPLGAESN